MKIITVLGTRPEIIRLSRIIPKLDKVCNHIFIFTNQNYDKNLRDIFFEELKLRQPDYYLGAKGTFGEQMGKLFPKLEKIIEKEKPNKMLLLGDTNSGLSAIIAERMGIPCLHLEAGNRAGERIPEEINRHIIDSVCTINAPYTHKSKENLLREGFNPKKIIVSGNPILEVINYYKPQIDKSDILKKLNLKQKQYVLVTVHRQENVDNPERFNKIVQAYNLIAKTEISVIVSTHPRTRSKMNNLNIKIHPNVKFLEPFGFFDFIALEKSAKIILTDSGTVQEEACILHIPCVITRKATERMETIECGASILAGIETNDIWESYKQAINVNINWNSPDEYLDKNVSNKVIAYLLNKWAY